MTDKITKVKALQTKYKDLIESNINELKSCTNDYTNECLHEEQLAYTYKYTAIIEVLRILEEE